MRQTRRTVAAGVLASSLAPGAALAAADLALVAQYGAPEAPVTIFETDDGALAVFAHGGPIRRLSPTAPGRYGVAGGGELLATARGVRLNGAVLPRRDFGVEVQAGIRRAVRADPKALRERALAATPPVETGDFLPSDLVDLAAIDPTIAFDIRYAGRDNFMGLKLYERSAAWLQRPAAEAVGRAAKALAAQGWGLTIHDAYRPWFVTWMFWEATPPASRVFVADPAKGSRHNRGCAVDLTLHDLKTGEVVLMPSRYDEMSTRSYADFAGGTARQRALRRVLREAMVAQGFEVYPEEWWHFDYGDWRRYPIGTRTFTELAG
ncbi:M15 family metallopeptidase [Caulobacter sp. 602-2]|uniref:D-alanyl-D-alanine dipeptidase n=1 Tax=Caulobacter sp. 602-2 TaxID=2710887 RepID=A0A6G4QSV1_9CAUL|nr:M15 family metallopeptidase [Caulobacter sp. 602-2]NGM48519.1 M15 family metallopeptidase [Caulobacter sp. 602-2]